MRELCFAIGVAFALCTSVLGEQVTCEDLYGVLQPDAPKIFGDAASRQLMLALDDFDAILAGRYPKHGKLDPTANVNHSYKGEGYIIRIYNTPTVIKNGDSEVVAGYIYGPQLILSSEVATAWGEAPAISRTRFYRTEELKQLHRRSPDEIRELKRQLEQTKEKARTQRQ